MQILVKNKNDELVSLKLKEEKFEEDPMYILEMMENMEENGCKNKKKIAFYSEKLLKYTGKIKKRKK